MNDVMEGMMKSDISASLFVHEIFSKSNPI